MLGQQGTSRGVAFENRVWGTICTIGHYLKLFVFLNARIKREVQIAVRNRCRCWCLIILRLLPKMEIPF